jgi:hypothetical protein
VKRRSDTHFTAKAIAHKPGLPPVQKLIKGWRKEIKGWRN